MPVLDGIRGLAALMVVFFHLQSSFGRISFPRSYLAVDVFFAMSALVLWSSYGKRFGKGMTMAAFIEMRLIRLCPLYLLGSTIGIAVACFSQAPAPGKIVLALLMLPDLRDDAPFAFDAPAKSLFIEVIGSVGLVMVATRITAARLLVATGAGLAAAAALAMLKPEDDLNMGFTSHNLVGGAARAPADFSLGLFLARCLLPRLGMGARRMTKRFSSGIVYCWLPMLLAFAELAAPLRDGLALPYDIAVVTIACPAILAMAALARPGPRLTAAFRLAGIVSFPLYAVHDPIRDGVALVLERHGSVTTAAPAVGGTLVLCVIVALLADRRFDRPLRRALWACRGRRASRPQVAGAAAA